MDNMRVPLLSFEKSLLVDTHSDDCLFILAKGLDIERLFLGHLYLYSDAAATVLVINTELEDEQYFVERLKKLNVKCSPKLLTADVSTKQRVFLYNAGGVQFVTSRILTVDLLSDRVPVDRVAGILVYRAHRVLDSFQESFILRLFREKRRDGFVKAFTDDAARITRVGIGQLQRLVSRLYVRRVVLMPRFDSEVKACFEQCKPKFTQVSIDLPQSQKKIRSGLSEIISTCVRDLKQCSQGVLNTGSELDEVGGVGGLSAAAALKASDFEEDLRRKTLLVTERQERLLSDLNILRVLLHKIEDLDAASAWHYICRIRGDKDILDKNSGWIYTPTATAIFNTVEQLCFSKSVDGTAACITLPPKWNGFILIVEELRQRYAIDLTDPNRKAGLQPVVLVLAGNEKTCYQLMDVAKLGQALYAWKQTDSILATKRPRGFFARRPDGPSEPAPLWEPHKVVYYDPQNHEETLNRVREEQKKVGREVKKRNAKKIIDPKMTENVNQPKLVNFGIIRHGEKREERRTTTMTKRRPPKGGGGGFGSETLVANGRAKGEITLLLESLDEDVPKGMLPEDPLADLYDMLAGPSSATVPVKTKTSDADSTTTETTEESKVAGDSIDDDVQVLKHVRKPTVALRLDRKIKSESQDGEPADGSQSSDATSGRMIFMALGNRYNLLDCLERCRPAHIILYNVDIVSNRIIEAFQAHNADHRMELYSLMYTDTTEEERYLVALQREQFAFEALIREQGVIMAPAEYDVTREAASHLNRVTPLRKDSRRLRREIDVEREPPARKVVVVDMREFNSELPTVLYRRGVDVAAATLEVGDYVLSPQICVERKALDDLAQSLNGGRIFKQAEQMLQHYTKSILLIESSEKFRQRKVNGGPFQGELSRRGRETRLLLTMLIRAQPKLALMWSFSPAQSAEFFEELTLDQPNPSADAASAIRTGELFGDEDDGDDNVEHRQLNVRTNVDDELEDVDETEEGGDQHRRGAAASQRTGGKRLRPPARGRINVAIRRSLLHFPGLLAGDVDRLMKGAVATEKRRSLHADDEKDDSTDKEEERAPGNLAELFDTSAKKLGKIMQNGTAALELIDWFHTDFRLVRMD